MTHKEYGYRLNRFLKYLDEQGIVVVEDVSREVIETYREQRHETLSARSVHHLIVAVHAMFSWAVRLGFVSYNPAAGLVPKFKKTKRRALTDDERTKILTESAPQWRSVWALFLATGLRRAEVCALTLDRVVLDSPVPHLMVLGKGSKERDVPLVGDTIALARALSAMAKEAGRESLIGISPNRLGGIWRAERDDLGLPTDITLHSFRHDFATYLVNDTGIPLTEARDVLGHGSVRQTEEYVAKDERMLRAGMEVRAAALFGTRLVSAKSKAS